MKTYLSIGLIAILFTGCSLIPSKFDSVLYDHLVEISVDADQSTILCGTPAINAAVINLTRESKRTLKYTQYASRDINATAILVDRAITELDAAYRAGKPSTAYCKIKLEIIVSDLDLILGGLGGKTR